MYLRIAYEYKHRIRARAINEQFSPKKELFTPMKRVSIMVQINYKPCFVTMLLKMARQILGRKIYKNTKKASLLSHLIFVHKTPTVENHPTTRKIRELLRPRSTPTGITV